MNLDDSLAAWAAAVRLPAAVAGDIYQQIVTAPVPADPGSPGLDPAWWRDFNAEFATRMVASTRTLPFAA